ncbi:hypothetical protein ACHAWF_018103 [Thalassiosira exigua]
MKMRRSVRPSLGSSTQAPHVPVTKLILLLSAMNLPLLFAWSQPAIIEGRRCVTSPRGCFIARCDHNSHRRRSRCRRTQLRAQGQGGNTMHGATGRTKRIRHSNGVPPQPQINGGRDHREEARVRKLKMKEAQLVEKLLFDAVRKMSRGKHSVVPPSKLFPSVRKCNAALATFGDAGEFRRALKLFAQMKRSASLFSMFSTVHGETYQSSDGTGDQSDNHPVLQSIDLVLEPPKPTLVTYSTLMSRAVSLGKPRVALRLWNLMRNQPNFYSQLVSRMNRKKRDGRTTKRRMDQRELKRLEQEYDAILPDVICCNTLMNAHAKLGDHATARSILDAMIGEPPRAGARPHHEGIPPTDPTVVSYNTLADACKVAGELGAALEVPELMVRRAVATGDASLLPDEKTYTILISTVARKRKDGRGARDVRSGGERDPDMAFALLNRMINEGITPNGVTYCALIDVCSRCRRNDLALNGLRIMLKQKSKASLASRKKNVPMYHQQVLFNEVGAWTAAINACGKTGRIDTATRLFRTMQKFGVKPNAVTCGCLSDCLLKANPIRITETLEVLQYMKNEGLVPGEVMYTA